MRCHAQIIGHPKTVQAILSCHCGAIVGFSTATELVIGTVRFRRGIKFDCCACGAELKWWPDGGAPVAQLSSDKAA